VVTGAVGQTGVMTDATADTDQSLPYAQPSAAAGTPSAEAVMSPAEEREQVMAMVEQPAKVMRIGTMIKQLLEEVRAAPLDEAGRQRLREIHETSIRELEDGLAPELREELDRFTLPFGSDIPTEAELRIAQAQLVGWLEGLFHGIQTALFAQQMAARAQLEEIRRRALPGGSSSGQQVVVGPGGQVLSGPGDHRFGLPGGADPDEHGRGTGQYL
jgi:Protein of unknown function (DUF2587)